MAKKKRPWRRGGLPSWNRVHIRSLGLETVEQYRSWCRENGFRDAAEKHWREEREESEYAARTAAEADLKGHLQALGLQSAAAYKEWCRQRGFSTRLDKNSSQRQREIESAEREETKKVAETAPTVAPAHWRALGLDSLETYLYWCRARGLSEALNKSEDLLRQERQLAVLTAERRQQRQLRDGLWALASGADIALRSLPVLEKSFSGVEGQGRWALLELLLHAERTSRLMDAGRALSRLGDVEGNTFAQALVALAQHWRSWLRPIGTWKPSSRNPRRQFYSLARHLLARYEVPFFMDAAFFVAGPEGGRQRDWFIHMARGGNIRRVALPTFFSKAMAHRFVSAPDHYLIEEALRWAQVRGQGGSEALAVALLKTRLGRSFVNEDFWQKVVLFVLRQPMLDPAQIKPIVDHIHRQKYARREVVVPGGTTRILEPPDPNFGMKGRSIMKLLAEIEKERAIERKEARRRKRFWQRSGIGEFAIALDDERTRRSQRWTVQELLSSGELAAEGRAMSHCVASYAPRCQSGQISIWSMQVEMLSAEPRRVMTIAVNNRSRMVTETRGKHNALHGYALDADGRVPVREDIEPDAPRASVHLKRPERARLQIAPQVLHLWMRQEGLQ